MKSSEEKTWPRQYFKQTRIKEASSLLAEVQTITEQAEFGTLHQKVTKGCNGYNVKE